MVYHKTPGKVEPDQKKKAILNGKKLPSEGQCSKLESFESCNSMASDFPFKKMQDTYDVSSKV